MLSLRRSWCLTCVAASMLVGLMSSDAFNVGLQSQPFAFRGRPKARPGRATYLSEAAEDEGVGSVEEDEKMEVNGDLLESSSTSTATTASESESPSEDASESEASVPPAGYSISSSTTGPASSVVHTLTVHLGAAGHPEPLVFETGQIGRQASGSVTLTRGDTVVYSTACRDKSPKEKMDFVPLSVDYQERFSSVGTTSGAYNRRDGRPAEHEVLTCRLIDRPLRPLIHPGWRHETQILAWVLSYDGNRDCDPLAISASAAALWLSDVPLTKPVAAVAVGYVNDTFVLNPTNAQMEQSRLHLTLAGTAEAVLMIEGAADFLTEHTMAQAVAFGHKHISIVCQGLQELADTLQVSKKMDTIEYPPTNLQRDVDLLMTEKVDASFQLGQGKNQHSEATSEMTKFLVDTLTNEELAQEHGVETYPDQEAYIKSALKSLIAKRMYLHAKATGLRSDGRQLDQVRQIDVQAGLLPRVHGSALFTRGETQALATATLGDSGMRQRIEKIDGMESKRFYLQYTFPPSCVGETGRVGAPGRREVGHGNLAERALIPVIPSEEEFPYCIRVESLITESHGSSSMASVCGGCLALMDAGVPIERPVAGIAMGMLLGEDDDREGSDKDDTPSAGKAVADDSNAVILTDILGSEDAMGTMDFKVAGDRDGITTFQLDIKCEGLTLPTLQRALHQAKLGRLHILDEMAKILPQSREELPPTVPRIDTFQIPIERIGKVIGPGGKQIRAIIEDFELTNMDVQDDGTVQVSSSERENLNKAKEFIEGLIRSEAGGGKRGGSGGGGGGGKGTYAGPEPEVGQTYKGKITGVHPFGVFLEILPGAEDGSSPGLEGLCHVSELHVERVRNCEGFVASMRTEELEVKYLGTNDKGQLQLSRKAVLMERNKGRSGAGGSRFNNASGSKRRDSEKSKPTTMSEEEVDVISQAIEDIKGL